MDSPYDEQTKYYEERECELQEKLDFAELRIKELEAALRPFSHAAWRTAYGGNIEGDASIVMRRNEAKLTLGDFRRANKALKDKGGE